MSATDWENPSGLNSEGTAWYAAFAKDRVVTLRLHTTVSMHSVVDCFGESLAQGEFEDLTAKDAKVAKDDVLNTIFLCVLCDLRG